MEQLILDHWLLFVIIAAIGWLAAVARVGIYNTKKQREREIKNREDYYKRYPWKKKETDDIIEAVNKGTEELLNDLEKMKKEVKYAKLNKC